MTITINSISVTPVAVEITGCDLDFLFDDFDEQIEEKEVTFRFDRTSRGHMLYHNRILTIKKCTQPTMRERINALLGVTTSISPSFIVKD